MPDQPCPGLQIRGLTLRFGRETVFEALSFDVPAGQCTALLGPSGVGKSSVLKIIAGLVTAQAGSVVASDGRKLAGRLAYMGQTDLLFPWLNVLDNVALGARLRGQARDKDFALHLLEQVGLAAKAKALPGTLSGGMRQRAALARTLYERRPVVLMDEPFSALDPLTRARLQELAAGLLADKTSLLITHDPMEACRLGHGLLVLTGHPARLGPVLHVPGAPPRAPDDEAMLRTQGQLLRALMAEQPA